MNGLYPKLVPFQENQSMCSGLRDMGGERRGEKSKMVLSTQAGCHVKGHDK